MATQKIVNREEMIETEFFEIGIAENGSLHIYRKIDNRIGLKTLDVHVSPKSAGKCKKIENQYAVHIWTSESAELI